MTDVREGTVPSEDFWISCYHQNEPSVHGKVRTELDEKDRHLVLLKGRDGVQIERGDQVGIRSNLRLATQTLKARLFFFAKHSYLVSCPQLSITKTRVVIPNRTYVTPKTNVNPQIVRLHSACLAAAFRFTPQGSQPK